MKPEKHNRAFEILSLLTYSWALRYLLISNGSGYSTFPSASKHFIIHVVFGVHSFFSVIGQLSRLWWVLQSLDCINIQDLIVELLWTEGYTLILSLYIHILCYREEICNFLNMWIQFEENLDREENLYI